MLITHPLFRAAALVALILLVCSPVAWAGYFSRVVVDPGHGGDDRGGRSGKVYEKHLALDTAMRLEHYLKAKGYLVTMTRKSDTFISLAKRAAIGNRFKGAIFVSLHYNYTWRRSVSGLETYYYSQAGKPLAEAIQEGMLKRVGGRDRGVKYGRYYVLRASRNPAVLVEGGFVSNSRERSRMKTGAYRDAIARGIADGIIKYRFQR
ncbi:MAG: N-acetylmuramoyl-L-alanine amidase [Roseibacillus sp.]|nr:N-acetylmuramoyl-L-alanine amidase [Roseibacillus sp.]HCQ39300.1 N-acetylmuramoyl-L-alanine amidase [Verrucomicrobiales bacterium]|tara:strand:- start:151 stop:768 length:618 start_codon:yes stop_codon:yes gene_type:complete